MKKILPCMIVFVLVQFYAVAQSIGIGTVSPHGSAILDISSTSKGLLIPRMTSVERSGIATPATGLMIYDLTTESLWLNTSDGWVNVNDYGVPGWRLTGNTGSNPATNFIGTMDNQSLMFKVNNQPFGMLCNNRSVFWGEQAGINNTGYGNIAIGDKALFNNTDRSNLVAIGDSALYNNGLGIFYSVDAINNTALGSKALYANTRGSENTATGYRSLYSNNTGYSNTANGCKALEANTTGHRNTATGNYSLYKNTTGYLNTAIGYETLKDNLEGARNTAIGVEALWKNTTGNNNVASGMNALGLNKTGSDNTACGNFALYFNIAGSRATAIGNGAMENAYSDTVPFNNFNVAVGYDALWGSQPSSLNTGNFNTAIGYQTLRINRTGDANTANGYKALFNNLTGDSNTAVGQNASLANYSGGNNTAVGVNAISANSSGSNNTAVGVNSIFSNTSGSFNSALGKSAFFPSTALENTTCIGYNSGGNVNASNRVEIGNTSVSWIGGQQTWSTYSDGRIKDNIVADVPGLDFITLLRPVTYNLNIHRQNEMVYGGRKEEEEWPTKYDVEQIRTTGFIAQEVADAANEVGYDFSGVEIPKDPNELYSLRYSDFVVPLVKAVQEQQEMIESQQAIIQAQQQLLEDIQNQLQSLQKKGEG